MIVDGRDASAQLADLVERAAAGEEIIIVMDGHPRARLMAYAPRWHPQAADSRSSPTKVAEDSDRTAEWSLEAFEREV